MADKLIKAGAKLRAKNRRGAEPLHAAEFGTPGSFRWDPAVQAATIVSLIGVGADPNAQNMDGATPLHRAVRTRCADAVAALLSPLLILSPRFGLLQTEGNGQTR